MILNINKFQVKLVGIILLFLFVYFRFIKQRLPRDLTMFYEKDGVIFPNYFFIWLSTISLITATIIVLSSWRVIYKKPLKVPNNYFIKYILIMIQLIKEILFSVYKHILDSSDDSYERLREFCTASYKILKQKEHYIVYFEILLWGICCICFLFDVIVNFKLYYFYYGLLLSTLCLIIKLYWHIMADVTHNISIFTDNLIIEHKFLPDGQDHFTFSINPNADKETAENLFNYNLPEYLALVPLYGFLESYNMFADYYKPRAMFIIYICYLIGWVYVIYQNFLLYFS